jgi:hypothetical protein
VYETLQKQRSRFCRISRTAELIEQDQVARLDERRCHAARDQEKIGALRIANTDVTESVQDAARGENAIRADQLLTQVLQRILPPAPTSDVVHW